MLIIYISLFIFALIIGTLGHFLYEKTNHNKIVAIFFAVNESVWEHIKLGLTPIFITSFILYFLLCGNANFWIATFFGMIVFMGLIPLLFYSYTYVTKKHILLVDISIFIISLLVSYSVNYLIINSNYFGNLLNIVSIFGIIVILAMYLSFTYKPLNNKLFMDPSTRKNGFQGHVCMHRHWH